MLCICNSGDTELYLVFISHVVDVTNLQQYKILSFDNIYS